MGDRKVVLVVDDSHIERIMMKKLFSNNYEVLLARDGIEALEVMRSNPVNLVLLDITMPRLDGYGVLREMQKDKILSAVPVIVVTGTEDEFIQDKALDHGAQDIISKPFSPNLVLKRVANQLSLQNAIQAVSENELRYDPVTHVLNRAAFIPMVHEIVSKKPAGSYVMSAVDIDGFKLINDRYGHIEGDRLLCYIAELHMTSSLESQGLICRDMGDVFFSIAPLDDLQKVTDATESFRDKLTGYNLPAGVDAHIGRYIIDEPDIDVGLMMDRALMAVRSIKRSSQQYVAMFNEDMRKTMLREKELIEDMRKALGAGQFVLYFQPQYNYDEGAMTGAEALVRWMHPEKGLISPSEFIPVFEKNGFISELDKYVWEAACRHIRAWMDEGINPVPISVNVSRHDFRNMDLTRVIPDLIKKYDLAPGQLNLEITESAYMDTPEELVKIVEKMKALGFTVEMDDFGAGYSSLNILKDVPVDILKLDIKFVRESSNRSRGGSILSSVVRMAHWLKVPVIAEGVETKQQADYLKSIGCLLMQGFYFNHPMPMDEEFKRLLKTQKLSMEKYGSSHTDIKDAVDFFDASTQSTLLFNSFVGGAVIAEYDGVSLEYLRMNDRFFEVINITRTQFQKSDQNVLNFLDEDSRKAYIDALEEAIRTGVETECEMHGSLVPEADSGLWTKNRIRFLAQNVGSYVFYITVENITEQKNLERKTGELADELTGVIRNLPDGIIKTTIRNGKYELVFASDRYVNMLGYSREEFDENLSRDMTFEVHPDDVEKTISYVARTMKGSGYFECRYRLVHKDGHNIYVEANTNAIIDDHGNITLYTSVYDIQREMETERDLHIREEAYRIAVEHQDSFVCLYDIEKRKITMESNVAEILNLDNITENVPDSIIALDIIAPESVEKYKEFYSDITHGRTGKSVEIKRKIKDGEYCWFRLEYEVIQVDDVDMNTAVISCTNIDSKKQNEQMASVLRENNQLIKIIAKHSQRYLIMYDIAEDRIRPLGNNINVENNIMKLLDSPKDYFTEDILAPESVEEMKECYENIKSGAVDSTFHFKAKNLKGEWIWMECTISNVFDDSGKPLYAIASFEDVTDNHEKKLAFERYKKLMYSEDKDNLFLFDYNLAQDILVADSGNINADLLEESKKGYMHCINKVANDYIVEEDKQEYFETFDESRLLQAFAIGSDKGEMVTRIKTAEMAEPIFVKVSYQMVTEPYNASIRLLLHCAIIDEKKRAELKLIDRARRDALTQVLNRETFIEELYKRIESVNKEKINAFAILDIDHFKEINDTFGHLAGDEILRNFAETLKKTLFKRDIVGRLGGDEFGIFMCGFSDTASVNNKAEEILENTRGELEGGIRLSASIGIALLSEDCSAFEELYEKSDKALYHVKRNGRNGYYVCTD